MDEADSQLKTLVMALRARLGRLPTEEELLGFIYGDHATREALWNK